MDGRDAQAMSPYYLNRGLGSPAAAGGLPGMRSFQLDTMTSSMMSMPLPVPAQVGNVGPGGSGVGHGEQQVRRKRGRPRKYGPEGGARPVMSPPVSFAGPASVPGDAGSGSGLVGMKRGRGRPPGTGRKQQLASLGEWMSGSAGMGFTPHLITIPVGEDIATKIMSFSQQGPRAICILSATGDVSKATLRQPVSSGGTITYEGRFEILCLSGSYLLSEDGGSHNRSGGLSISLAYPDGRVIGGGVGGLLIAASPVQVIVGSFLYGGSKAKDKAKNDQDSGPDHDNPMADMDDPHNNPASLLFGAWAGSRQNMDIDLTRG